MTKLANIAAEIHANMCNDSGFGYSWGERYGTWDDPVTWNIEGRDYTIARGDYDCSSSVITAWKTALQGTPYEGVLDGATYTGNMRSVFVDSGLFDVWDTYSTNACRGDIYLNDNNHTAMCQDGGSDGVYGYDALSEFCINEFGGTYGGQRGDQTGGESHITGYYSYPWSCTLHYNGRADDTSSGNDSDHHSDSGNSSDSGSSGSEVKKKQPEYRVYTAEQGWLDLMKGLKDTGDSNDDYAGIYGLGIRYLAADGVGKYRVCTKDGGWLPYVDHMDLNSEEFGMAGDGSSIVAVQIPSSKIKYQVHVIGDDWYPWMIGKKDTGGSKDTYAGDKHTPIDAIRITRV